MDRKGNPEPGECQWESERYNLCFFTRVSPGFPVFRREWQTVPRVGEAIRCKETEHWPWIVTRVEWYDNGLVHLMLEKETVDGWRK